MSKFSRMMRRVPVVRHVPGIRKRRQRPKHVDAPGPPRSFALNDLDLKLVEYIGTEPGFFVEAGANDGITQSNTLYFEKFHHWTGLLIEPIPQLAEYCKIHRPQCTVVGSALVALDYPESTIEMNYCNLMSLVKGAMKSEEEDEEHLARGRAVQGVETYPVTVNARSLSDILDQNNVRQVDLLSLDVEGYELAALQGLDLDRHRPRWILVEARFRDEIDRFLCPIYEPVAELTHHDVLYRCASKAA